MDGAMQPFEADVGRVLDLVINSLYKEREIFLRELISNASDACDKLRYARLSEPELLGDDPELKIRILADEAEGAADGQRQRHRHGPRRPGREPGHHRALGHRALPRAAARASRTTTSS